jgi:hypothetical protein
MRISTSATIVDFDCRALVQHAASAAGDAFPSVAVQIVEAFNAVTRKDALALDAGAEQRKRPTTAPRGKKRR